jgi:hypothetical protein
MSASPEQKPTVEKTTALKAGRPQGGMSFMTFSGDCLRAVGKVPAGRMWVFRNFPRGAKYLQVG